MIFAIVYSVTSDVEELLRAYISVILCISYEAGGNLQNE
jgi:hypothetical protein